MRRVALILGAAIGLTAGLVAASPRFPGEADIRALAALDEARLRGDRELFALILDQALHSALAEIDRRLGIELRAQPDQLDLDRVQIALLSGWLLIAMADTDDGVAGRDTDERLLLGLLQHSLADAVAADRIRILHRHCRLNVGRLSAQACGELRDQLRRWIRTAFDPVAAKHAADEATAMTRSARRHPATTTPTSE